MSSPLGPPLFARGSALFNGLLAAAGVVELAAGGWPVLWLGGLRACRFGEGGPASGWLRVLATAAAAAFAALSLFVWYFLGVATAENVGRRRVITHIPTSRSTPNTWAACRLSVSEG